MTIYSGFSHEKWWFSIAMLFYQRVWEPIQYPTRISEGCYDGRNLSWRCFWCHVEKSTCSLWLTPGWLWGPMGPYQGGLKTLLSWSREASTEWPGGLCLDGCHSLLQLRYQLWVGKKHSILKINQHLWARGPSLDDSWSLIIDIWRNHSSDRFVSCHTKIISSRSRREWCSWAYVKVPRPNVWPRQLSSTFTDFACHL